MKQATVRILLGVNAALLLAAGALWLSGETAWQPPAAQPPDPASLAPEEFELARIELAAMGETLERPIFAATRRPPPPVAEVAADAPPPSDPLKDVQLLGVFEIGADKHLMVRAEGKVTRLKVGETVGPWTVRALNDREVTFAQGAERRQLVLKHAAQPAAARLPIPLLGRNLAPRAGEAPPAAAAEQGAANDRNAEAADKAPSAVQAVPPAPPAAAGPGARAAPTPAARSGGSLAQRLAERRASRLAAE
ncbi:hypothetical protein, partial [Thauera propionica]|uniref:hypothetical protein n=1 Tax=Thauera propionica TaxID=2019431 RepID=UPI0023F29FBF